MISLARLTLAGVLLAAAVPSWAGEVKVSFSNGLVTIIATEASARQILAEWARQGQVVVSNLDRLAGGPVTMQMTNVPEAQALETLLRGTAGYVAAPRAEAVVAASSYDRIMLMPGVAPALPVAGSSSGSVANPGGGRGRPSNLPAYDATTDNETEPVRRLSGPGRDAARPDPYGPSGQGQVVTPGIRMMAPSYVTSPNAGVAGSPTTTRQGPATDPAAGASRQRAMPGAATPGVMTTAPPQATEQTPYGDGTQPIQTVPANSSAPLPGGITRQPGQPAGGTAGGARPGELTAAPTPALPTFQNPYGLPEAVRAPVVDPNANPYGLPNPTAKPTPPATTPTGPIKRSGTDGGQGSA